MSRLVRSAGGRCTRGVRSSRQGWASGGGSSGGGGGSSGGSSGSDGAASPSPHTRVGSRRRAAVAHAAPVPPGVVSGRGAAHAARVPTLPWVSFDLAAGGCCTRGARPLRRGVGRVLHTRRASPRHMKVDEVILVFDCLRLCERRVSSQ